MIVEENIGTTAQACRALGLARSSFYLASRVRAESRTLRQQITALNQKHPRYGYRRITALLRREGHEVNGKRVQRVRRVEGLQVSKKQRRMRRGASQRRSVSVRCIAGRCGAGILWRIRPSRGRASGC
jgi:hypothetical protein